MAMILNAGQYCFSWYDYCYHQNDCDPGLDIAAVASTSTLSRRRLDLIGVPSFSRVTLYLSVHTQCLVKMRGIAVAAVAATEAQAD